MGPNQEKVIGTNRLSYTFKQVKIKYYIFPAGNVVLGHILSMSIFHISLMNNLPLFISRVLSALSFSKKSSPEQ